MKQTTPKSNRKTLTLSTAVNAVMESMPPGRTRCNYAQALGMYITLMGDTALRRMNGEKIEKWVGLLKERPGHDGQPRMSLNTVDYYIRTLRVAYFKAMRWAGLRVKVDPFGEIERHTERTVHRALTADQLRRLISLDDLDRKQSKARDVFLLTFMLRGIAPVDLWGLTHANYDPRANVVRYRRSKTTQTIEIALDDEAMVTVWNLMTRWCGDKKAKLFELPSACAVNKHLKAIGEKIGLRFPLTLYVARHTWASVAQGEDVPISVISKGLGHSSIKTTQIYLAGVDTGTVDRYNSMIINKIFNNQKTEGQ